jgi:hypothetical protein
MTGYHIRWVCPPEQPEDPERIAIRKAPAFGKVAYDRFRIQSVRNSSRQRATDHAPSELLEITVQVRADRGSCALRNETPASNPYAGSRADIRGSWRLTLATALVLAVSEPAGQGVRDQECVPEL